MSLFTALIAENSHILTGIYFIFLKKNKRLSMSNLNRSGEIGNEDISYQVRQNLLLFCKLLALILG